jgi:hypothetical protein
VAAVPAPAGAPVRAKRTTGRSGVLPLRPEGPDLEWRNEYRRQVETATAADSPADAGVAALLRRVAFFAGCSDEDLVRIASTAYPIAFEAGAVVCTEGAESLECYVVAEGTAEVSVAGRHIDSIGADDVIGERGPLVGAPRSATVTAATHLSTYAISRDRLLELVADPAARAGMEAAMSKRYARLRA